MSTFYVTRDGFYMQAPQGVVKWVELKRASAYARKDAAELAAKNTGGRIIDAAVAERRESGKAKQEERLAA